MKIVILSVLGVVFLALFGLVAASVCAVKNYSRDSSVCVCNSTYCDTFNVTLPKNGKVLTVTSSKGGLRFTQDVWSSEKLEKTAKVLTKNVIKIDPSQSYQTLKGFGGALTDAASLNAMNISTTARDNLIKSYFGKEGIEYNLIRIPIGACDFSTRKYTYLDTPNDFNLSTFALAPEDTKIRIPLLKQILASSFKPVSLYASPWSAPAWMKTNGKVTGYGRLRGVAGDKYHKTWAEYFTKYFDAYKSEGIIFWGVTMQNEPSNGLIIPGKWQSMGWTAKEQKDFIKLDLGPMLKKNYSNIKLMIHDDQHLFLPHWPREILSDSEASQYVSGIGVHWYFDWLIGPKVLNDTHKLFPHKFILATEACNKQEPTKSIGSWEMGEQYSSDILDNLNNWAVGWVDWNMFLNTQGGPNWVDNFDNSPIIVNATADEFYKQPMYYHLGHFSKFIPEGSFRIHSVSNADKNFKHVAIQRQDGYIVIVVLNKEDGDIAVTIEAGGYTLGTVVPKRSVQTYLWKNK